MILPVRLWVAPERYSRGHARSKTVYDYFIVGGCVVNRKLIRPTLAEVRERSDRETQHRRQANDPNRKRVPPEQTHAESFYYKKQMDNRTQMVIVLQDGEELRG